MSLIHLHKRINIGFMWIQDLSRCRVAANLLGGGAKAIIYKFSSGIQKPGDEVMVLAPSLATAVKSNRLLKRPTECLPHLIMGTRTGT